MRGHRQTIAWAAVAAAVLAALSGCRSPEAHRADADRAAYEIAREYRAKWAGVEAPFTIERPSDTFRRRLVESQGLPTAALASNRPPAGVTSAPPERVGLVDALRLSTRNSREYQEAKESVFKAALKLDLERDAFRTSFAGALSGAFSEDRSGEEIQRGVSGSAGADASRKFSGGANVAARLALDLVKLLTLDRESAMGLVGDLSITVPLLRGAGRDIVLEPVRQAEKDAIYSIHDFERFKRSFAVSVAAAYLNVLEQQQQIQNLEESYRSLQASTRRAEQLAQAGRLEEIQVNLSRQDELRAMDRLNTARQKVEAAMDEFKVLLGLPTDARMELVSDELDRLPPPPASAQKDSLRMEEAVALALERRLDLAVARGRRDDAERAVRVAADALRGDLALELGAALGGQRTIGSADQDDAELRPDRGRYTATLNGDLPWERTAERNAYRLSLVTLDVARRAVEQKEDAVKLDVRGACRRLEETRAAYAIQQQAYDLARRRVDSTELMLQAGRAEMRDLLEARESLLSAQNSLVSARVAYRVAEWTLLRDLETLEVTEEGLWKEAASP